MSDTLGLLDDLLHLIQRCGVSTLGRIGLRLVVGARHLRIALLLQQGAWLLYLIVYPFKIPRELQPRLPALHPIWVHSLSSVSSNKLFMVLTSTVYNVFSDILREVCWQIDTVFSVTTIYHNRLLNSNWISNCAHASTCLGPFRMNMLLHLSALLSWLCPNTLPYWGCWSGCLLSSFLSFLFNSHIASIYWGGARDTFSAHHFCNVELPFFRGELPRGHKQGQVGRMEPLTTDDVVVHFLQVEPRLLHRRLVGAQVVLGAYEYVTDIPKICI